MIITEQILENSRQQFNDGCYEMSKLEYVGEGIFEICTYETAILKKITRRCLEVAKALTEGSTFDYYRSHPVWYLVCMNYPFFANRTEWGTSIRGAWWNCKQELNTCGIFIEYEQICDIKFSEKEWNDFVIALCDYCEV